MIQLKQLIDAAWRAGQTNSGLVMSGTASDDLAHLRKVQRQVEEEIERVRKSMLDREEYVAELERALAEEIARGKVQADEIEWLRVQLDALAPAWDTATPCDPATIIGKGPVEEVDGFPEAIDAMRHAESANTRVCPSCRHRTMIRDSRAGVGSWWCSNPECQGAAEAKGGE